MPIERKLAAIMFTDIAGYTALSAKDENKALALLDTQNQILTPIIEQYNGTLHNRVGDGLLFTFSTVTDAVRCGIKIQEDTKAVDDLNLRIGIHEGEITLKDGDALGDDVNIASRIDPFATEGGIVISSKVQQNISSLPEFETSYVGNPELKGVAQKVEVYSITSHGLPKAKEIAAPIVIESKSNFNIFALTGTILTAIGIAFWIAVGVFDVSFGGKTEVPSIAIIPFDNKGADEDDYYAYSLIADLISDVTGSGLIRVASLNDIEKLDYQTFTNNELSKELLVRYIAQGTLWKKDSILQLTMELYDTKTSDIIWTERWEKGWQKLNKIPGELAENIINSLNVSSSKTFKDVMTNNAFAYDYYLKGKFSFNSKTSFQDIVYAREMLNKALELDENLLDAKILLGRSYLSEGQYDEANNYFISCVEKSILINNQKTEAECNNYLGDLSLNIDFSEAINFYNKALNIYEELSDSYTYSIILYKLALLDFRNNNYDNAIENLDTALDFFIELDDLNNISKVNNKLGEIYFSKGDYEKSLGYYKKSEEQFESSFVANSLIDDIDVVTSSIVGNYIKSLEYYEKLALYSKSNGDVTAASYCYIKIGDIYSWKEKNIEALTYYVKAYQILSDLKNYNRTCTLSKNIANLYYENKDLDSSLIFFQFSKKWCKPYLDQNWDIYKSKMKIYLDLGDMEKISSLNHKIINLNIGNTLQMNYYHLLRDIGHLLHHNYYSEEALLSYKKAYDYYEDNFDSFNEKLEEMNFYIWYFNPSTILKKIGQINYTIGNNEEAIEYLHASLEIYQMFNEMFEEKMNSKKIEWNFYNQNSKTYYLLARIMLDTNENASELKNIENYLESLEYFDSIWNLKNHLIFKNRLKQYLNIEINKNEIIEDIERYKEYLKPDKLIDILSPYHFYHLYLFLDKISYLESAYNQIQEEIDDLEPNVAAKFLSYPIPAAILEEWEKVK